MHNMTGLLGADGSVMEYHGRRNFGRGLIIERASEDALFLLLKLIGQKWVNEDAKGTGVLRLPDGRSFAFPVQ